MRDIENNCDNHGLDLIVSRGDQPESLSKAMQGIKTNKSFLVKYSKNIQELNRRKKVLDS